MDLFNRKRVAELERERDKYKNERDDYRAQLAEAERDLQDLLELKSQIPDDCVPGEYCKACNFNREYFYHYRVYPTHDRLFTGFMCNKANVCKNFMQKEVEE